MNFMNRRMFQAGGSVTYADGTTQTFDVNTFQQKINTLPDNDLFALKNSADAGQIVFSPELKSILDQATQRKAMPFTQNIGMKPASISSTLQDYGRVAKGVLGPIASGLTRQIFSEEQLEKMPLAQSIAQYDSPFYGEGSEGFKSAADRAGRTTEELEGIIRKSGDIQDFTKDIEAIEQPVVEAVETKDVLDQPTVIEELPTLGPVTGGETLGVMSPLESTQRRLAFEEAMIGRDEFGNLLPEGRLLQDPTIAKALEELTPIESLVDINKTEADSLLETQDKFDGKFDIPKIELDKVDTTKTLDDFNIDPPPVVPRETTGIFGSDRFLDFIRNVGGELARTGQMGEGLATGAAKAGEERAARDLLEADEQREFNKAKKLLEIEASLEGKGFMDYKEANSIGEAEESLSTTLTNFQKSEKTLGDLDDVFKDLEDPNAYGATGWLQESMDKFAAAAGMSTGKWKDLSARSRINATLEVLTQMSVREVLGESGKTISNLDRQIVAEIFGNLTIFTDPSVIKDKLTRTRNTVLRSMQGDKDIITKDLSYFARTGVTSPLATQRQDLIDRILGIDLTGLEAPGSYRGSSTSSEQIYDTTL